MRTKTLIVCLTVGFLAFDEPAWAARNSFESKQRVRQTHRPGALSVQTVSGVIPRAIRGGNPLQMLNPFAPAKYGTAADNVSVDPEVPGKVNGVKFVSIPF